MLMKLKQKENKIITWDKKINYNRNTQKSLIY